MNQANTQLLERAVRCYVAAGWADDACRVYESLGEFRSAAYYHEQQGRWKQAAQCYELSNEWENALRCFLHINDWPNAATCFEKLGRIFDAAWIYAHHLHRYLHARHLTNSIQTTQNPNSIEIEILLARIDIGLKNLPTAAQHIKNALTSLQHPTTTNPPNTPQLIEHILTITTLLKRPDLTMTCLATAINLKTPQATEQWEKWAIETLGEASYVH